MASFGWRDRYRLWRQGARALRRGWIPTDDVSSLLEDCGFGVASYRIDVDRFWEYVEHAGYREREYYRGGKDRAAVEKWLEHFVSIELIRPSTGESHVDIASCASPFPDILREQRGCTTYRQDLSYPEGNHGDRIGCDAANLCLPPASIDGLTLHCSFEHFEGDRDIRFIREAGRVLRAGGRLCILPLYLSHTYSIQTDLEAWRGSRRPTFEKDAAVYDGEGWGELHGRFYDPTHFAARIGANLGTLDLTIYRIENEREVAPDCYLKFAALFRKAQL